MKTFTKFTWVVVVAVSLGGAAFADDQGGQRGAGSGTGTGTGTVTPPPGRHDGVGNRPDGGRGQIEIPKIGIPPNANLSDDLKKLITQYQDTAQKFAAGQKDLLAQLKGATDEQKQTLKDQLKANRQQFLDDTTQLRADIREQLRELRQKIKDSATGAVDTGADGKGKGRPGRP